MTMNINEFLKLGVLVLFSLLPMEVIDRFFTLMLFISAPLIARATSQDAAQILIDAIERFIGCAFILAVTVLLREVIVLVFSSTLLQDWLDLCQWLYRGVVIRLQHLIT
ncbi:hypothetical protein F5Y03DRAFT_74306 [Xylaria venustula]|nr:hypothetical protein F5Y03DRAFT_74306 [Xylaria venustula]